MSESFLGGRVVLHYGDSFDVLKTFPADSVDAVVCDPPYGLGVPPDPIEMLRAWLDDGHLDVKGRGFMGREWDAFVPQPAIWREVFRVLKPGGHVLAFFGTRTYDIGSLAIRLAGFEIRDLIAWVYGSGFPKSHDVSKAIDRAAGVARDVVAFAGRSGSQRSCMAGDFRGGDYFQTSPATSEAARWQGWGTALKPALEPVCFARKPLAGTVAANVLAHGTGAINIDGCRVGADGGTKKASPVKGAPTANVFGVGLNGGRGVSIDAGRHPANILHDGSPEVIAAFPANGDAPASRFFYSAKASAHDRIGSKHPTVKPIDLMQWLCRLVTPPGGVVLDPFAGTGTTGEAAWREGFRAVLVEREAEFCDDIRRRMRLADRPAERKAAAKSKGKTEAVSALPLFGGLE